MTSPWVMRAVARLTKPFLGNRCGLARRQLELALSKSHDLQAREKILNHSLAHFLTMAWLMIRSSGWSKTDYESRIIVSDEDRARFLNCCGNPSGMIVITAHLGNWEFAVRWIATLCPGQFHVVTKNLKPAWLDRYATNKRLSFGAKVVKKNEAARGGLSALRAGGTLGVLMDQNRPDGLFVDFFGRLAGTSALAPTFGLRTGAPIVPLACFHEGGGRFRIRVLDPVDLTDLDPSDRERSQLEGTRRCNQALEKLILEEPGQWLWTHRRYKACADGQEPLSPLAIS